MPPKFDPTEVKTGKFLIIFRLILLFELNEVSNVSTLILDLNVYPQSFS